MNISCKFCSSCQKKPSRPPRPLRENFFIPIHPVHSACRAEAHRRRVKKISVSIRVHPWLKNKK